MNEIKQRLEEKYLKMEDYYNISFDVLRRIFKQNKMLIIIFILINMSIKIIAEKYQGFLKFLEITGAFDFTEVKNYWYSVNASISYFNSCFFNYFKKSRGNYRRR